jgi:hypothetical protein|tara:strand:- start:3883 stop:4659 length:777 start_codon:yes stop_codon:yes gene_type:complete
MKIDIISKNQDLIGFTSCLTYAGHEVQAVNKIEPCDILIYDIEFKKDMPKIDGIKIENYNDPSKEVDDDFSISFVNENVSYKINDCCVLTGKGQKREELECDISVNNPNTDLTQLVIKFISLKNKFKIFSKQAVNTFNYCGIIPENNASDLYVSSKVNIALDRYALYRILESGGTPLTNIKDIELPEEMVFNDIKDFEEKAEHLINNEPQDITDIRNEIIKKHNPFVEWANIFNKLGLKKASQKTKSVINAKAKDLYF